MPVWPSEPRLVRWLAMITSAWSKITGKNACRERRISLEEAIRCTGRPSRRRCSLQCRLTYCWARWRCHHHQRRAGITWSPRVSTSWTQLSWLHRLVMLISSKTLLKSKETSICRYKLARTMNSGNGSRVIRPGITSRIKRRILTKSI